jgi:hypothetical protein
MREAAEVREFRQLRQANAELQKLREANAELQKALGRLESERSDERERERVEAERLVQLHAREMDLAMAEIERLKVAVGEGERQRGILELELATVKGLVAAGERNRRELGLQIESLTREREDALRGLAERAQWNHSPAHLRMMRGAREIKQLRAKLQTSSALEARRASATAQREARRGSGSECSELDVGHTRFEPVHDGRNNALRHLHGERWSWQWMQMAFLAIRLSPSAYVVMRHGLRLGESRISIPSVRTVQRRTAAVRDEMVVMITSVDLIGVLLTHVREEYGIPADKEVLINLAMDASYTTADGRASPGPNHGVFTWFVMPLDVRIRPFVVHVCQTENARVDAMVRGRNEQVLQALRAGGFRSEAESTDGDSGTTAVHTAQHVQHWTAREVLSLLGSESGMGASLFDKVRLLRALGLFDEVRWAADFLHWARTIRNRVLDRGHIIVRTSGGEPICREEIVRRMPGAPGVDGPGLDSAESKFQDAPPIAMNSIHSLVWAMSAFPEYGRLISIGVVIQAALRLMCLSRLRGETKTGTISVRVDG